MQINTNNDTSHLRASGRPAPSRPARSEGTPVELRQPDSLLAAAQQAPVVRPEEVARAKELVSSPQYPPSSMIGRIARLMAMHLDDVTQ